MIYRNPDIDIRELDRIYNLSRTVEDWTRLAIARERQGLIWPAPENSFCPGFRFMTPKEINIVLERSIRNRSRVEAIYAPGHGYFRGYIKDWPAENIQFSLPHWTKTRFYAGRSGGTHPVFLMILLRNSTGGPVIYNDEFVYIRELKNAWRISDPT